MPDQPIRSLRRSFDVYYRDRARTERMDALNAEFVRDGSLAFDIGAHVGDRSGSFLRLGARVVALEPQPKVFRALRLIHGRSERITLLRAAAGAEEGRVEMRVNSANPTTSTVSRGFIAAAENVAEWQGEVWDKSIDVPVTTLNALIETHGMPDFTKIDVEGYELEVLKGLTAPLPALSFEFTTIQLELAVACLAWLTAMARYEFKFSLGEDHRMVQADWVDDETLKEALDQLPRSANSGDIFARRK